MLLVLMQYPGAEPKAVQSTHKGQHWKRLAKKNAIVQAKTTAIMVHTDGLTNVPLNILVVTLSASADILGTVSLPFVEKQHRQLCKSKSEGRC